MGVIHLKNIKLYAFHGCMPEERSIGSEYAVNIKATVDTAVAEKSDRLEDTVDYGAIVAIVKQEMKKPSNLLENVAHRIVEKVMNQHSTVKKISVKVAKINPPTGGNVAVVSAKIKQKR